MSAPSNEPSRVPQARVYERNLIAFAKDFAIACGGGVITDDPGARLCYCPGMEFCNGVVSPKWTSETASDRLRAAIHRFKDANNGMLFLLGPSTRPANLREHLLGVGAHCTYHVPLMHLDRANFVARVPQPKGIVLRWLKGMSAFKQQPHPWFGRGRTVNSRSRFQGLDTLTTARRPRAWQIVAYAREIPVGTVTLYKHQKSFGVYFVCVERAQRRRGIGTALMHAACAFAFDQGASAIGLGASGKGVGMYRKVGFAVVWHGSEFFLSRTKVHAFTNS
ncbi:MAG: GNAT family N-acetyltransferase [Opitutales bacterium]